MSKFNIGDIVKLNFSDSIYSGKEFKITDCEDGFFMLESDEYNCYGVAEEYLEAVEDSSMNNKELTFKEIIIDWDSVKEGEVWKNKNFIVSKDVDGDLKLEHKDGFYDCSAIFLNPKDLFELQRKQYTFEEAFRSYEEGKEIESCETGARFIKSDNKDMLYDPTIGFTPFGRSFNIDEIRAKWYVNNK